MNYTSAILVEVLGNLDDDLSSASQQLSSSPQQPKQPAAILTPQTQSQQPRGQHQTQPEGFGSPSTASQPPPPCSTQLPGSQPQTATQPSGLSPLRPVSEAGLLVGYTSWGVCVQ